MIQELTTQEASGWVDVRIFLTMVIVTKLLLTKSLFR